LTFQVSYFALVLGVSALSILFLLVIVPAMSAEEENQDYNIESADAGASLTIPMEAGQIKKGG
jgi:hypothetical protein